MLRLHPAPPFSADREHLAVERADRLIALIVERVVAAKIDAMPAQPEKLRFAVLEQKKREVLGQQWPLVRRTLESIRRLKPRISRATIDATTEADIRRQISEDGQDEPDLAGFAPVIPPRLVRKQLGMTQAEFARALRIPLSTLRNWEQGRVLPDPAARSLLTIVARNPKAALRALAA